MLNTAFYVNLSSHRCFGKHKSAVNQGQQRMWFAVDCYLGFDILSTKQKLNVVIGSKHLDC